MSEKNPTRAILNARALQHIKDTTQLEKVDKGWQWRENDLAIVIKFPDTRTRIELSVLR